MSESRYRQCRRYVAIGDEGGLRDIVQKHSEERVRHAAGEMFEINASLRAQSMPVLSRRSVKNDVSEKDSGGTTLARTPATGGVPWFVCLRKL